MHKQAIYRYICYLTGNSGEAPDLFQDTWLRVAKHLHRIHDPQKVRPWIFTIATNLHRDHLRKKKVRSAFWNQATDPLNRSKDTVGTEPADPAVVLEREETGRAIRDALNTLPEKLKRVFILREIEGFTYNEISDILDLSQGTAKSRMHRAVRRLRQILADHHPGVRPRAEGYA